MTQRRILVTGGAGYVGAVLVRKLLQNGHFVRSLDLDLYGNDGLAELRSNPDLDEVRADLRDHDAIARATNGIETVIHFACISNDPSFELDPALARTINYEAFAPLVETARASGVSRFIYASSSSVYGISEASEVTEAHPLNPLTDYSRYKAMCESILSEFESPDFTTVTIRPATVCGFSPRMRLDLSVNILTNHAVNKRAITVFGGSQLRPNIHIEDLTDLYVELLDLPREKIAGKIFNAGYQNHSINELAQIVRSVVETEFPGPPVRIEATPTDDLRSYHVNSEKISRDLGWSPRRTVEDAVRDLCVAFRSGRIPNSLTDPKYSNVQTLKQGKVFASLGSVQ
jgi:nucleoside-diphosphate-sugar epimerase